MMVTPERALRPGGETLLQFWPPSCVTSMTPLLVPAQITPARTELGAKVSIETGRGRPPGPGGVVAGCVVAARTVRSGLICFHVTPPSVMARTYCAPM